MFEGSEQDEQNGSLKAREGGVLSACTGAKGTKRVEKEVAQAANKRRRQKSDRKAAGRSDQGLRDLLDSRKRLRQGGEMKGGRRSQESGNLCGNHDFRRVEIRTKSGFITEGSEISHDDFL